MDGKITSEGNERTLGREAQRNNILAARAVADIVKTTLGPKGMDKMLVDRAGDITVTNDGATILDEMEIEHPAAKMLVEISKTQEKEVGDGTTTVVLLAGKLLERAETLLDKKVHPTVIAEGYRLAEGQAERILQDVAREVNSKEILMQIAKTAMTGKGAEGNKDKLSRLIVEGVDQVSKGETVSLEDIKIEKVESGRIEDSELVSGIVLNKSRANKEMPSLIEDARILLVDFPLEIANPEMQTQISISSPEQLESFVRSEEMFLKEMVGKIKEVGANVVFCQKG
ncbi:MAG: thermosome subunit, partial [Nanoarchaeota archaeon]|nr:thermosome subunit [Nanoarchaeota archaeon]